MVYMPLDGPYMNLAKSLGSPFSLSLTPSISPSIVRGETNEAHSLYRSRISIAQSPSKKQNFHSRGVSAGGVEKGMLEAGMD